MNRRTFLGTATALALRAADSPRIGIGLLGASYSHAKGKLEILRNSGEWKLVGVAESDPKIVKQLDGIPTLSREELLAHPDIRVIAVESAVHSHAADGLAVLKANKHLHLEKAPAANLADFREIVDLAKSRNLLLQVGYMWRYHPGISKALEAAKNGWLGPVRLLRASISNELAAARRPEWAEFKGGVMFELGGHVIDPMVRLMGAPEKVTARLRHDSPLKDNLIDNTLAVMEWGNAMGIVQASTLQPDSGHFRSFEIQGENGTFTVSPIEPATLIVDMAKAAGPYKAGIQEIPLPPYKRFEADFADLAGAVRKDHSLKIGADDDLNVQDALLRCSGMV